jgi:probable O-glycosylation ligase (exosortase A-associated)
MPPLRDLALLILVLGMLPFIFKRPHWGILMWTWIGIMSPHRLAWGFAQNLPIAMIVGLVTMIAILFSREPKKLPLYPVVVVLFLFDVWLVISSAFAIFPADAWPLFEKVAKVQLFIFLTMLMMQTRDRIEGLVWVSALSLGFFGVKGGLYTLTGGAGYVLGPPRSYIAGNTEIALAMTMTVPLLYYLVTQTQHRWIRWSLWAAMGLTAVAVLGSFSRGGMLAIAGMAGFFWLKSRHKFVLAIAGIALIPVVLGTLPERWFDKMATIRNYEADTSAMGRINAWGFAINLAKARPLTGGGFGVFDKEMFLRYAPNPADFHDAHSIWFEVLGEQGFVGLGLYLLMWLLAWRTAGATISACKKHDRLRWAVDLLRMVQVSLVGYFIGGTFLGLAYWDFPFVLVALIVLTKAVTAEELKSPADAAISSFAGGMEPTGATPTSRASTAARVRDP